MPRNSTRAILRNPLTAHPPSLCIGGRRAEDGGRVVRRDRAAPRPAGDGGAATLRRAAEQGAVGGAAWDASRTHGASHTRIAPPLTPLLPLQVRLLMLNLASRLIGYHRLLVPNFYPFLQRYLQPHQREITLLLTFLVQASHELVPPEALQVTGRHRHRHHRHHHSTTVATTSPPPPPPSVVQPQLLHLANHFVSDKSRASMVSVGLNTIREVRTVRLASGAASDPTADPTSRRHKSAGLRARPPRHGRHSALRSDRVPQGS